MLGDEIELEREAVAQVHMSPRSTSALTVRLPEGLLSASDVAISSTSAASRPAGATRFTSPHSSDWARAEPAAEQHQLLGPPRSDQTRQTLAAAPARDEAEIGVLIAEPSRLIGHDEIDDERELEAAGEGEAVDARDDRDGQCFHAIEHAVPQAP